MKMPLGDIISPCFELIINWRKKLPDAVAKPELEGITELSSGLETNQQIEYFDKSLTRITALLDKIDAEEKPADAIVLSDLLKDLQNEYIKLKIKNESFMLLLKALLHIIQSEMTQQPALPLCDPSNVTVAVPVAKPAEKANQESGNFKMPQPLLKKRPLASEEGSSVRTELQPAGLVVGKAPRAPIRRQNAFLISAEVVKGKGNLELAQLIQAQQLASYQETMPHKPQAKKPCHKLPTQMHKECYMPLNKVYQDSMVEIKKWRDTLNNYIKWQVAEEKSNASNKEIAMKVKAFEKKYDFFTLSLNKLESILTDINRQHRVEDGKHFIRQLNKLIKSNETNLKNMPVRDNELIVRHRSFKALLDMLVNHATPLVNQAEVAMAGARARLPVLNAECISLVEDWLKKKKSNVKFVSGVKQTDGDKKPCKRARKIEKNPPRVEPPKEPEKLRNDDANAHGSFARQLGRNNSTLFSTADSSKLAHKRKPDELILKLSSDTEEDVENDSLHEQLTVIKTRLQEIAASDSPIPYTNLLESLAIAQTKLHHDKVDELMRRILMVINAIEGYENYRIKVRGYDATTIATLSLDSQETQTASFSLSPPG